MPARPNAPAKIPSLVAACAIVAVLAFAGPVLANDHGPIGWYTDPRDAFEAASASRKPILVDAWAVWCAPCKVMDQTTWKDDRVVAAAESFVPLKIDHDMQTVFVDRYRIEALPVMVFLDSEGDEITRHLGMKSAEEMLELMNEVLAGYEEYREALEDTSDRDKACRAADYLVAIGNPEGAIDLLEDALRDSRRAPDADKAPLEVRLGEAELATGSEKKACKLFTLARDHAAADDEKILGRALVGLVRAERERGREEEAAAAMELLREKFPDLARSVEAETADSEE